MPVKGILFDLFHTLVDVGNAPGMSGRYTADILGIDRSEWKAACFSDVHDITRPTVHRDVVRAIAHSVDPRIPEDRIVAASDERQRRFDHALRNVHVDVLDGLEDLKERGLRLALVSNASSGEVSAWDTSPLADFFDAVVFSCECGHRKPEREVYELGLDRIGLHAREALFVGDGGAEEHIGARKAGLRTVLFTRFVRRSGTAVGADRQAGDFTDLLALLRQE